MGSQAEGWRHGRAAGWLPWALAALAAAYAAVLWTNPFREQLFYPDSYSYTEFDSQRTAGYPLFLDLVASLFGTVGAAPGVQLLLAAAAFAFLGWSIHRAFDSPLLALLVALSLFGNPELAKLHAAILTESAFVSLLCVMIGTMAMLVARPTVFLASASALACGVAVAVRPAAISLLPIWPILLWFIWGRCAGRRLRLAASVAAPLAICVLAESMAWQAGHPDRAARPSLANRHLFAKALMMEPVPAAGDDELDRFLSAAREQVAPARAFVVGAPDWQTRLLLLTRYEVAAQYQLFRDELATLSERRGVITNQLLGEVGWRAIASVPAAWVTNAMTHYAGLWGVYELLTPAASRRYAAYVQSASGFPFFETGVIEAHRPPHAAAWPSRVIMAAAFLGTVFAVGAAVSRRLRGVGAEVDGRLVLAAICGLLAHGHYLLVALFGVAAARYSLAMCPLLALCVLLLVSMALSLFGSRDRPEARRIATA